jgi:hypothetical protein
MRHIHEHHLVRTLELRNNIRLQFDELLCSIKHSNHNLFKKTGIMSMDCASKGAVNRLHPFVNNLINGIAEYVAYFRTTLFFTLH